jgi:lantibiotic biosynthesis protein
MKNSKTKLNSIEFLKRPSCLFVKVYLDPQDMDSYLCDVVKPLVAATLGQSGFQYFYFVRYHDRGFHLRLRFFGDRSWVLGNKRREILSMLNSPVVKEIEVSKYRPEWKRYGGKQGMAIAEKLFAASSKIALEFLSLKANSKTISRAEFALASGETLLNAIGLSSSERSKLFVGLSSIDLSVLGATGSALTEISNQVIKDPRNFWKARDSALRDITLAFHAEIRRWYKDKSQLPKSVRDSLPKLALSYLHMHCNRLGIKVSEERVLVAVFSQAKPLDF